MWEPYSFHEKKNNCQSKESWETLVLALVPTEIVGADNNNIHLRIKEALFIMREKPCLNIQGKSFHLALF